MRIAFIENHPAPYRDDFLGRVVNASEYSMDVYTLFGYDSGHAFWSLPKPGYEVKELAKYGGSTLFLCLRLLIKFVFSRRYDFVLWPAAFSWYLHVPLFLSALLGKRYAYGADSIEQPPIGKFAYWVKSFIVRHAEFIFVPGKASEAFFKQQFGLSDRQILKGVYALDGEMLERKILDYRINGIRQQLGFRSDEVVFLMVANMIKSRCYPITSEGFLKAAKRHPDIRFVMIGKGSDWSAMQELSRRYKCLTVVPGCSFEEMLKYYAAADVYVHGGAEPASTALIIGAIANLPLISSLSVGCSADVLVDTRTGCLVEDYHDSKQWEAVFERVLSLREQWGRFGEQARLMSAELDVKGVAEAFVRRVAEIKVTERN